MDSEAVKEAVLDRVLPEQEEREQNWEMFEKIKEFIKEEYGLDAALMGSTAKETFISGDKDLDIFVFFPTDIEEEKLEETGLEIGKAVFDEFDGDYTVEYADHPYTKGVIDGYDVEIVPAYNVASGADIQSAVDRTPFHTEWVNEHLSEAKKKEVVVLKAFLRGQEVYGSTLKVEGFSGYLCELLVAKYGSFEAVLEAALEWEEEQTLDPGEHHDALHDVSDERRSGTRSHGNGALPNYLKTKFKDEQLVVIDPVDEERNVASVLSNEHYAKFIYAAWQYMRNPSKEFFFPETEQVEQDVLEQEAEKRGDFVLIAFPTPDVVDDILYPQMRSLMNRLTQILQDNDFRIFESGFHVGDDKTRILFELYADELPEKRKQLGPRVFHNRDHLENFTDKYGDVWVEDDRLVAIVDRDHTTAQELLEEFLHGDLQEKGVPKHIAPEMEEREITDIVFDGEEWRMFLRDSFNMK